MRPKPSPSGFSLTELLVVLCLISILAAFSIPAMSGITFSGNTRTAAVELSSVFNEARMLAVSQNTYTYVFFKEDSSKRSLDALLVCSTTGINTFENSAILDLDGALALRPIRSVELENTGFLPNEHLPSCSVSPYQRPLATAYLGEGCKLVHKGATFDKSIAFRPTGEMAVPQSSGILAYGGLMEFALSWNLTGSGAPALTPRPVLLFQVAGATGQTSVHRAQ